MNAPRGSFAGHLFTVVLATVVAGAFAVVILLQAGVVKVGEKDYELKALLPTSASLATGATVRIGGATVGKVSRIERRGTAALVTMRLDKAGPLPAGTKAGLRLKSLIGENFVELSPGRSATKLRSGTTLPIASKDSYVEIDQVLATLQGPVRERARQMLRGLGDGLEGRGDELNATLREFNGFVGEASPVAEVLSGDRRRLGSFVDHLGRVLQALGDRKASITQLAAQSRRTFGATAAEDASLRAMLDELPATIRQVRSTTRTVDDVTSRSSPVLDRLATAIVDLKPAVDRLRPAARQGTKVLAQLKGATPPLRSLLSRARSTSPALRGTVAPLVATTCEANPLLKHVGPYSRDAMMVLSGLGSTVNYYDRTGHAGRIAVSVGEGSLVGVPTGVSRGLNALLSNDLLSTFRQLGYNPYPKAGSGARGSEGSKASGPFEARRQGVVFPRIKADC